MLYRLSYVRPTGPKIAKSALKFGRGAADVGAKREIGHPRR
jgi:hypothetical protein